MPPAIHVPSDQAMGSRHIDIAHVPEIGRVAPFVSQLSGHGSDTAKSNNEAMAFSQFAAGLPQSGDMAHFRDFMMGMATPQAMRGADFEATREGLKSRSEAVNEIAKAFRTNTRHYQTTAPGVGMPRKLPGLPELHKGGAIAKAVLDVGTSTQFNSITGGQSLGYVSLDTRIARGTVRPDSFTLYQALPKSAANQVVDYWTYVDDTGGPLPGAAFTGFSNVQSGTLSTDIGSYSLQNVNLKLALDGRAITLALAAQNSFADVQAQENANAALSVLSSQNWSSYFGNPTLYANQTLGLASSIPTANVFDFLQFYQANAGLQGWSTPQTLYNLIYEAAAQITSWGTFGRITHAFMTPTTNGSLQGLVTTVLNNITNTLSREQREMQGIVVDGDLQGMRTRMGVIQFPLDLFISSRNIPAQAQVRANGTNPATLTGPTKPATVTVAVSGAALAGSNWGIGAGTPYVVSGNGLPCQYTYAVASTDVNSNESTLTFSAAATGITATGAFVLTIAPPGAADAINFRVYRSGNGYSGTSPTAFRYIGTVAASGSSNVTFTDSNAVIPGSETIFLLDMHEDDFALDFRFLLPLTKIELFAQNLYMPWAVAMIGAIRNRIPKFHGIIQNYVPDNPSWSPLAPNK